MIDVKVLAKCRNCDKFAKIEQVSICEDQEEVLFVREYLCECGCTTKYSEVVNYIL